MKNNLTVNRTEMMCCLMPNSRADDMMGDAQQPLRAS